MAHRLLALTALIASASCTATYDPDQYEGGIDGYWQSVGTLICNAQEPCCGTGAGLPTDICIAAFDVAFREPIEFSKDDRLGFDPELAARNLDQIDALTAVCSPNVYNAVVGEGLLAILAGTKTEGEDCTPMDNTDLAAYQQCLDGLSCQGNAAEGFRCSATPLPPVGEPCATYQCEPGAYCGLLAGAGDTCLDKLADRESCWVAEQCRSGLCVGANTMSMPPVQGRCDTPSRDDVYCIDAP
ncbi:MAG: hypothetical protein DRJ42_20700 [Deltaproteobacteria bacterium]|nr:MAG: hypothetical protein DRJ42_20700 [Deltaproteobacteria bacterium]